MKIYSGYIFVLALAISYGYVNAGNKDKRGATPKKGSKSFFKFAYDKVFKKKHRATPEKRLSSGPSQRGSNIPCSDYEEIDPSKMRNSIVRITQKPSAPSSEVPKRYIEVPKRYKSHPKSSILDETDGNQVLLESSDDDGDYLSMDGHKLGVHPPKGKAPGPKSKGKLPDYQNTGPQADLFRLKAEQNRKTDQSSDDENEYVDMNNPGQRPTPKKRLSSGPFEKKLSSGSLKSYSSDSFNECGSTSESESSGENVVFSLGDDSDKKSLLCEPAKKRSANKGKTREGRSRKNRRFTKRSLCQKFTDMLSPKKQGYQVSFSRTKGRKGTKKYKGLETPDVVESKKKSGILGCIPGFFGCCKGC